MKLFFQTDILCLSILNTESWEKILLKPSPIAFTFYCFHNEPSIMYYISITFFNYFIKYTKAKVLNRVVLWWPKSIIWIKAFGETTGFTAVWYALYLLPPTRYVTITSSGSLRPCSYVCTKEGQKDHGLSAAFTIFCVHNIDR